MTPNTSSGHPADLAMSRCDCTSCRLFYAYDGDRHAQQVSHDVYWSLHCSRCGDEVEFDGIDTGRTCTRCDAEMETESRSYELLVDVDRLSLVVERVGTFRGWLRWRREERRARKVGVRLV